MHQFHQAKLQFLYNSFIGSEDLNRSKLCLLQFPLSLSLVLSIFYLTFFYNEHAEDEAERQALIASIEKLRAMSRDKNEF